MSQHQSFRRKPVPAQIALKNEAITIPAPNRGIIESENAAFLQAGAAMVCDNWAPTLRGVKLRGGYIRWCELPETTPIISGFEFVSGDNQRMYAANASKLYDVSASSPVLVKGGQLSGNYVASQMSNANGDWMLVANEAGDYLLRFDGTTWITLAPGDINAPVPALPAAPPTCVDGHNLTYVCKYRNRFFFIEGGTMNAWYLPLNAIEGTLGMIPLAGAATRGGKLLFCAVWSIDAGDGIDDKLVFCTDLGELLIFTGGDPGVAANWRQEGRYQVPPPMGMNAHMSVGGDLLIATIEGIVPTSLSITKDATQLQLSAITQTINSTWRREVAAKRAWPWTMRKWDEYGGIFVTIPGGDPGDRYCMLANSITSAWSRFKGWDATCFMVVRGDMYFGTQDGIVMQADRTGYDDGEPYTATLIGGWGLFGQQVQSSTWLQARASFSAKGSQPFQPQISGAVDFNLTPPQPPLAGIDQGVADIWDQGRWGPDMSFHNAATWTNSTAYATGNVIYDSIYPSYWTATANNSSPLTGTFAEYRADPVNAGIWVLTDPQPAPPVPTAPERNQYAQWDQIAPAQATMRNTGWISIGTTGFTHAPIIQVTVAQQARPDVELIALDALFARLGTNI